MHLIDRALRRVHTALDERAAQKARKTQIQRQRDAGPAIVETMYIILKQQVDFNAIPGLDVHFNPKLHFDSLDQWVPAFMLRVNEMDVDIPMTLNISVTLRPLDKYQYAYVRSPVTDGSRDALEQTLSGRTHFHLAYAIAKSINLRIHQYINDLPLQSLGVDERHAPPRY